jgi:hypothetical protein
MTPDKSMLHLKRFGYSQPPAYGVFYGGKLCLGAIEATSPTPYPGRSKARYNVFPQHARSYGGYYRRSIGTFDTRQQAAEALLTFCMTSRYWRGRINTANKQHHA